VEIQVCGFSCVEFFPCTRKHLHQGWADIVNPRSFVNRWPWDNLHENEAYETEVIFLVILYVKGKTTQWSVSVLLGFYCVEYFYCGSD
jgi:hypothetical protein